jgi:DNA repair exonuclease SbcCD ATPase subunit
VSVTDTDVKKLAENVSSLQKDMAQVGVLVDRLDITIEKLTEVSSTVSQLLAVQGSRLEFSEKVQEKLQDLVEKRRQETDDNIKAVYNRIEKIEKDLQTDMETTENKIIAKIEEMQKTGTAQHEKINQSISDRINRLERWMWTAVGGGIVVVWLLNSIEIAKFFN